MIEWSNTTDSDQPKVNQLYQWYVVCEVMGGGVMGNRHPLAYHRNIKNILEGITGDFSIITNRIPCTDTIPVMKIATIVDSYYRYFDFANAHDRSLTVDTTITRIINDTNISSNRQFNIPFSVMQNSKQKAAYLGLLKSNYCQKTLDLVCCDLLGYKLGEDHYKYLVLRGQYNVNSCYNIRTRIREQAVSKESVIRTREGYNMVKNYNPTNAPEHNNIVITLEVILGKEESFLLEITDCSENWIYVRPIYLERYGESILKFILHIKDITQVQQDRLPNTLTSNDPVLSTSIGMIKYNLLKSGLMLSCSLPDGKHYEYILTTYINDTAMKEETGVLELNSENWLL